MSTNDLDQLAPAFIAAQQEFLHVVKASVGQARAAKIKYADLPDVIESIRPTLGKHGLGYSQGGVRCEGGVTVRTTIFHTSGQTFAEDGLFIPAGQIDPQGYGSAYSYARRYSLMAVMGIAADDDDGAAALQSIEKQEAAQAAADAAPKLDDTQRACITQIMAAAGHPNPDLSDKLAEDYATHVQAAVKYAVKQRAFAEGDAPAVLSAALAGDADTLTAELGAGVPA